MYYNILCDIGLNSTIETKNGPIYNMIVKAIIIPSVPKKEK